MDKLWIYIYIYKLYVKKHQKIWKNTYLKTEEPSEISDKPRCEGKLSPETMEWTSKYKCIIYIYI